MTQELGSVSWVHDVWEAFYKKIARALSLGAVAAGVIRGRPQQQRPRGRGLPEPKHRRDGRVAADGP